MSRRSDELRPALMAWLRAPDDAAQQAVLDEHPELATVHGLAALDELIMESAGGVADALVRRRQTLEQRIGKRTDRVEDRLGMMLGVGPASVHVRPADPTSGSFTVGDA
jgi:hypothetical protein